LYKLRQLGFIGLVVWILFCLLANDKLSSLFFGEWLARERNHVECAEENHGNAEFSSWNFEGLKRKILLIWVRSLHVFHSRILNWCEDDYSKLKVFSTSVLKLSSWGRGFFWESLWIVDSEMTSLWKTKGSTWNETYPDNDFSWQ
jgi:hypothetical protein